MKFGSILSARRSPRRPPAESQLTDLDGQRYVTVRVPGWLAAMVREEYPLTTATPAQFDSYVLVAVLKRFASEVAARDAER